MIKNFLTNFEYLENVNLKKYNTYRIESIARYLIFPRDILELKTILKYLKTKKIKYLLLSKGSNVILARKKYYVVIKLDHFDKYYIKDNIIKAEANVSLTKLAYEACRRSLSGLEFAGGIVGNVGASVAMNAGAYNEDMSCIVKEVKILDDHFDIKILQNKYLHFSYRHSVFKEHKNWICLEATLSLKKTDKDLLAILNSRKKQRCETQPLDLPSAGSVFRNPKDNYAGYLIENLGLKNYHVNGATISNKHANFIVNNGKATGKDIVKLIKKVQKKVKKKYNIDLILEQVIKR